MLESLSLLVFINTLGKANSYFYRLSILFSKLYFICWREFWIFLPRHILIWMCCSNIQSKQTNWLFLFETSKSKCEHVQIYIVRTLYFCANINKLSAEMVYYSALGNQPEQMNWRLSYPIGFLWLNVFTRPLTGVESTSGNFIHLFVHHPLFFALFRL